MAKLTILGGGIALIVAVIIIAGLGALLFSTKKLSEAEKPLEQTVEIRSVILLVEEEKEGGDVWIDSLLVNIGCSKECEIAVSELSLALEAGKGQKTYSFAELGSEAVSVKEIVSSDSDFDTFSTKDVYEITVLLEEFKPKTGDSLVVKAVLGGKEVGEKEATVPFLAKGYRKII